MIEKRRHPRWLLLASTFVLVFLAITTNGQSSPSQELHFQPEHRAIAHGNEYNSLALSSDEKRLFVGTEKGDVIVWNISERRIERKLIQGKPVHAVVALTDPKFIVASGEEHLGKNSRTTVRRWNVETGTFEEMPGAGDMPFVIALSVNRSRNLVVAAGVDGKVLVWDAVDRKVVASWETKKIPFAICLIETKVYVSLADREQMQTDEFPTEAALVELDVNTPGKAPAVIVKHTRRLWTDFKPSMNDKSFVASNSSGNSGQLTMFDTVKGKVAVEFDGSSASWINDMTLLTYEGLNPGKIVQVSGDMTVKVRESFEKQRWTLEGGREFELTGQVTGKDGTRSWSIYRKGAGLYEWDLKTKTAKVLMAEHGGVFSLSVLPSAGILMTGGADGFIRLWSFPDLSLRREFHIAAEGTFVSDAELLPDGKFAVVATMSTKWQTESTTSTEVLTVNLETGQSTKLITIGQSFSSIEVIDTDFLYSIGDKIVRASTATGAKKMEFATDGPIRTFFTSANKKWILAVNFSGSYSVFEVETGQRTTLQKAITVEEYERPKPLALSNDGRFVYSIGHSGDVTRWDTNTQQSKTFVLQVIRDSYSNVDVMILADNDTRLVTPGNHGNVGVFDAETGKLISYTQTETAAFWVEKVWLNANRLIYATDTGVIYIGTLEK